MPILRLAFAIELQADECVTIVGEGACMKRRHLRFGKGFHVVLGNERAQAATMTIAPKDSEGGPSNRHRGADQWLFVISGTGSGRVNGKRYPLKAGTLLLIERKDRHEIKCTGRAPLRTLNFYLPPAYSADGEELPPAKP
jgi:mannose-6-phosphate isomerase-like protein (cupin superfamily)